MGSAESLRTATIRAQPPFTPSRARRTGGFGGPMRRAKALARGLPHSRQARRSCLPRTGAADAAMKGGRSVTIGGSIALIVIGAILRFGITWKPAHVDLQIIGVILMIAGVVGLIISIAFLATRRRGRPPAEVYEERRYTEPPGPAA